MANNKPVVREPAESMRSDKAPSEKLTKFLYVLMRDRICPGMIESILVDYCELADDQRRGFVSVHYNNSHLEAFARELAGRLTRV
jgi:hypothetical protein